MAHDNHDHPTDRVPSDLLAQMGYETRDVTPTAILRWIGFLFVFIIIISGGILALLNVFVPQTGQVAYESEVYRTAPLRNPPPQPQLQSAPKRDMIMYRRDEERVLDGYNKTASGRISVPVGEAIDQIAAEGISGVKAGPAKPKVDAYPGSGAYTDAAPKETETPRTNDAGEANVAAPEPAAKPASAAITEERQNTPAPAEAHKPEAQAQ